MFECKLTSSFAGSYIFQTKKAIAERNASFGILVTLASKKGTAGFWTDNDVFVVHPFGAVHIAGVLRQHVLDLHSSRISNGEANKRATALMDYVKSDEFKNLVGDTIFRTLETLRASEKGNPQPQEDLEAAIRSLSAYSPEF